MKKGKFDFASTNGNFYEPDRFENMYLLPGELETKHETKSNSNTDHFLKRRNSLKNSGPPVKISDYSERPNKIFSSRPKELWQTSPRSTGSRPWSASTALSSSSTSSSSSHYSLRRKTRVEIILEEYAKLRESEQRREERGFRQLIETELKNNHHPRLLMQQDSYGLDRRPASAKVYRSRIKKTKAHCQSLRAKARKYHIKNRARCQRKTPKRPKKTRHDPNRDYVLFQSARFNVRVMHSASALACSVKISEKAVNGLDPAALIVRVRPLKTNASLSPRDSAENTTGRPRKHKKESKKSICLQIKLRDLRMICQHSSSVSAVLARCTPLPGLSVAANKQPVRLLDFILKPGRHYPHAIGRQISFQLGQCVMQALSLCMYPVARLVLTDKAIAAVRVQARLRQWVVKKLYNKRKQAVKRVQHTWRVRIARDMVSRFRVKKLRRELEHRSSVKIQRSWRERVQQRNYEKAAIKLQRSWRFTTVRRANSAVRIQCLWRCFGAVKMLMTLKDRASKRLKVAVWLESHYRRLAAQKSLRRSRAISRIQSFWRTYMAFTRMLEVRRQFAELSYNYRYVIAGAITKLQRHWRARKYQNPSANTPAVSQTIEMLKNRYDSTAAAKKMTRRMSRFMSISELPMDTEPSTDPEEMAATKIQAIARRRAQQRSIPPANEVRDYIHSLYRHADAECNEGDIDKNLFLSEWF